MRYLILLRGVNVGGKNKISMTELRAGLEAEGFSEVSSYINSGNILLTSPYGSDKLTRKVEEFITSGFKLDSDRIKVRALTAAELRTIVDKAPAGFGSQSDVYHSDVLFPLDEATSKQVMAAVATNPEVDKAWEKNGVVYFQRLSAMRTKSRLNKIILSPVYKSITIRSWNTTVKLLDLLSQT